MVLIIAFDTSQQHLMFHLILAVLGSRSGLADEQELLDQFSLGA